MISDPGHRLPTHSMTEQIEPTHPDLERQARSHAALTLWLVNVFLGVLVGTGYLVHLPEGLSARGWTFVVFGLVASIATLALLPAAVSWLTLRFATRALTGAWIQAFTGALFLSAMKVDTVVYSLLRYHFFSSAVFNVAVTSGSGDAVHLGGHVWLPVLVIMILLTTGEFFLWRFCYRRRLEAKSPREMESLFSRPAAIWGLALLSVIGVEKSMYAAADLDGDREVHNASDVLPGYAPVRVSQLFPEQLGDEDSNTLSVAIREKGAALAYPHAWPQLDPEAQRMNVLILVVDSWRRDMLDPVVTPQLYELSRAGRRFEDHRSGGNGTRFGIFSMLYGLHGSYWFSALEERRSPVLLDVLADDGYDMQVYSSASMNFPEFRDCAWVNCLDSIHDEYQDEHVYDRDLAVAADFRKYVEGRESRRSAGAEIEPFFGFVLLDSAHQSYDYPGEGAFQPAVEGIDYIELAHNQTPEFAETIFNRYRNALQFTDGVAADVIQSLRDSGEYENTLIIVTGDHGEEFQENGFWGHTSNFTPEQIETPFFLLGGVVEAGVEERSTTHLDIAPTVLEMLGADPAMRGQWCLGENLMNPPAERDCVVAGWGHVGVITDEFIYRVRMGGRHSTDISVYDRNWQPQNDANERIEARAELLENLSEECERFLLSNGAQ